MKLLRDILYKVSLEEVIGLTNVAIHSVAFDSRKVEHHSLFVAIAGTAVDGHQYMQAAIEKGALAVVCEKLPAERNEAISYIRVADSKEALGYIAANFYENPSEKLKLVGVTGTNGKTTVATLLCELFRQMDQKSGLLSTVKVRVGNDEFPATHTTPDPLAINYYLHKMVRAGCKYAFMEVSSHGLDQKRTAGLQFSGGIFTNITHDHLDYHKTFKNYIRAKKLLFDALPATAFALLNADDKNHVVMTEHCKAKVLTFGLRNPADFKVKIIEAQIDGMLLHINEQEFWTRLIGRFNAYNLAAVYGTAELLGLDKLQILTTLSTMKAVQGRFEYVKSKNGLLGIVDYAHTPDALENVLQTINELNNGRGRVITVVGCGGDRDKTKRPEMASIAANRSDKVILTSDNPRSEDPEEILNDMEAGLDPTQQARSLRIPDRAQAIKTACQLAQAGDIILVAGKGHERYQDIKGVKHPFDDMKQLSNNLNQELA
jgi:UDP-N-acetylmuramoyl-L-alanyl-D-glutamate--2,6-diaminopimelate ligase